MDTSNALRDIVDALMLVDSPTCEDVNRAKMKAAATHQLPLIPSNFELTRPHDKRYSISL